MESGSPPAGSIRLSTLEGFMPYAYVRQIYCFPTTDPLSAIDVLSRGLIGLAQDVPYILSRIIRDESGIAVSAICQKPEDLLSWNDLSESISYAALQAANFPPHVFLAPGIVPPDTITPYPASPAVLRVRASIVDGGLVLCVALHHAVTDIAGFGALLRLWAAHCRGESSGDIGFHASWLDRSPLFVSATANPSTLSDKAPMPDLLHILTPEEKARATAARAQITKNDYRTCILYFPQQRLRTLKDAVNTYVAAQDPGTWVSTSDVLASLLWSAIITAQEDSEISKSNTVADTRGDNERSSTLSFPVQFRSILQPPLPRDFLGAAFVMMSARVLHSDLRLISRPVHDSSADAETEQLLSAVDITTLARTALAIRQSIQNIDDIAVREVLAYLETHANANSGEQLVLGPPRYDSAGGSGTSVVSWADQGVYELDWGESLGPCDAVRLPKMGTERAPIVLPRVPSVNGDGGGLEVIMSYEGGIMQRVMDNPVIRQFAVLRCLS
ncbi:hypothetical protein F4777DRAFT_538088 [Nemania sp. FL0916]|nr:hypothetical protein F4777DRAFT_538088 [Nemania sp. FL0916]